MVVGVSFVSMLKATFLSRQLGYFISPRIIFQSGISVLGSINRRIVFQPTILRPQALSIVIVITVVFVTVVFLHDFSIKFKANL